MAARRFPLSVSAWAGLLLGGALFGVLATVCVIQYRAFGYLDFDLAVHVQSTWNLVHGNLDCSILGMPWPGNHANWILVLLAPVFALAPSPLTLLLLQAAALALGAWPVWLLARREFESDRWAWVFVAAYALYPALAHVALFEFHPVALAIPLLLAAIYCARIKRDGWFVFWCALAATCQENVPLVVITLCLYRLAFPPRPWRLAGGLAVAMVVWFGLCIGVIGPHFNRGDNVGWLNLYGQFGRTGGEIVRNLVLRPDLVWQTLWQPNRGEYLVKLLGPVLLLPLAAPELLLVAAPSFAQHLLSQRVAEQSVVFHYTATIIPFVIAATVIGAARVWRVTADDGESRLSQWHPWIAGALLAGVLGAAADWDCVRWVNSFAVFRRAGAGPRPAAAAGRANDPWLTMGRVSRPEGWLFEVARGYAPVGSLAFRFEWQRADPRAGGSNCWVRLDLRGPGPGRPLAATVRRGPLGLGGGTTETWDVVVPPLPPAEYTGELVVYDRQAYAAARASGDAAAVEQFAPLAVMPVGIVSLPGAGVRSEGRSGR